MPTTLRIALEQGRTKVFASALDWPGWSRWGTGDDAAVDELLAYAERYAVVAVRAGARFPASFEVDVAERLTGTTTTDFGAPAVPAAAELDPLRAPELARHVALMRASWELFDEVVASAPATLRKGPRGGGRDRDGVAAHVHEAERAYARKVGVRHPPFREPGALEAMRADLATALLDGTAAGDWPPAYAIRRITWHVLDHLWEIEDKS